MSAEPAYTGAGRPGAQLGNERIRQGLSVEDVAQRLRLRPHQVEAIERDDYSRLPGGTFLRGFLRNYAKLLNVDPERVLGLLRDEEVAPAGSSHIVVPSQNIRFQPHRDKFGSPGIRAFLIALALLIGAFAVGYWWFFVRPDAPGLRGLSSAVSSVGAAMPSNSPQPVNQAPSDTPPKPASEKAADPPATPAAAQSPSGSAVTTPSAPAAAGNAAATAAPPATVAVVVPSAVPAQSASQPPAAASSNAIRLVFSDRSWVEVTNARGKMLHRQEHPKGSEVTIAFEDAHGFVIGNARNVQMYIGDRPLDLAPHTAVNVARFTLPEVQ